MQIESENDNYLKYKDRVSKMQIELTAIHDELLEIYKKFKKACDAKFRYKYVGINRMIAVIPLEYTEFWKKFHEVSEKYGSDFPAYLAYINYEKSSFMRRLLGTLNSVWSTEAKDYREFKGSV